MAFTSIPNEAIDRMTELSAGAWRLYLYLARCRNQVTGKCCPSVPTSQQAIGVSRSAVFMARRHLIEENWARFDGDAVTWLKFFNPDEEMPSAETEGIVYVVSDGFGHYKIGYTSNLEQRLQVLNTGLPTDLEVTISYSTPHARNEETRLHRLFKDKRLKGEWFALADEDLEAIRNGIPSPENETPSPESKTNLRVVKSRKQDSESKKPKVAVQKIGPVVQKAALTYKEEQDERTRRIEQEELIPVAIAPVGSLTSKECYALFVEVRTTAGGYEVPYQNKRADFIQLEALFKLCNSKNWTLTADKFTQAATHYFATPRSSHTLADLAVNFSEFFRHALDRFGKPVANGNGKLDSFTPNAQATIVALETFVKRNMEKEND